jgi:dihydrolipoamide dehydrogenase
MMCLRCKGWAKITAPGAISVTGSEGGKDLQVKTKNIMIATGSEVMPFPGIEIDEKVLFR